MVIMRIGSRKRGERLSASASWIAKVFLRSQEGVLAHRRPPQPSD